MKNLATLVFSILIFNSCVAQWGNKIKGNGNVSTIERSVGEYDSFDMAGFFDIEIIDGKEGILTIRGEENLLSHIVTEVKEGKLILKTEKGYNLQPSSRNGIKITIPVKEISAIYLSGSGDITSKKTLTSNTFKATISGSGDIDLTFSVSDLKATISGSGDMDLSGIANTFDVSISGSGDIDAYGLKANDVNVSISGSGDVDITAEKNLKARVSGSGDINYRGNPAKVDTKSSGSGDISKG